MDKEEYKLDSNGILRNSKGHFVKGQKIKGKLKTGRPKKPEPEKVLNEEFKDDPMQALLYLMNNATTSADVFKYAKELMPYCKPKLSSVQSEIKQETNITISIEGFEPIALEDKAKDVTPIEHEELTEEQLEEMKNNKLTELDK